MRETRAVILAAGKGTRMGSDLPKVLHTVSGRPMIEHSILRAQEAGVDEIVVVVGYRAEAVEEAVGALGVHFVNQGEQHGTGHAVMQAEPFLEGFDGNVVVLYGDMPLLAATTIRSLTAKRDASGAAAVILTIELDSPPAFGRIVRDAAGKVTRLVEARDATPAELAIREVNVGAYCFDCPALRWALGHLSDDNDQGEYYLTDVIEILGGRGDVVETVVAATLEETLGINDPFHLAFAEKLGDIVFAESMYDVVDAIAADERTGKGGLSPD